MKKPTLQDITPELIEQWKKENSKVFKYQTEDGKVAYFKNPDLRTLDASSALAATKPIASNKIIANDCFLGGDEAVIHEDKYILGLGSHLRTLIEKVEGELSLL